MTGSAKEGDGNGQRRKLWGRALAGQPLSVINPLLQEGNRSPKKENPLKKVHTKKRMGGDVKQSDQASHDEAGRLELQMNDPLTWGLAKLLVEE